MTHDWLKVPENNVEAPKGKRRNRDPIIEALVERIASGALAEGAYLPTEQELVDEFSSSRTVIRECMQELVRLGLIETRPRVGARVMPSASWDKVNPVVLRAVLSHHFDASFYEPLIEARWLIEPEVAAMAAARAGREDIEKIDACFQRLEGLVSDGEECADDRVAADIAFHRSILETCGNWVFQRFGPLFDAAIMARMALAQQAPGEDHPFALDKHKRILVAIKERNPSEARRATLSVLALSKPAYADYFEAGTGE